MKKIIAAMALLLPVAAFAAEEKAETAQVPATETNIRMAAELSKYGYANNDALSLIQAARLAKQLGIRTADQAKTTEGGADDQGTKAGKVNLDATQLLADAKAMAKEDGMLLALIDDVNANVRGAVNGPQISRTNVRANGTDEYNVRFRAGETAIVTAIGDGDTDLDLYVYDQNGNLIDSDTDYTDNCVCTFTPRWTGNFKIRVVNRGRVYNNYVLRTN